MGWLILAACVVVMAGAGPLTYRTAVARGWKSPARAVAVAMVVTPLVLVVLLSFLGSVFER